MKIMILTPEVHFYSPVVMRELFENSGNYEFCVLLTPKISSSKKSSSSLKKIIANTGLKYLIYMLLLKIKYDIYSFFENLSSKPIARRRYLSPSKVCELYRIKSRLITSINSEESIEYIKTFSPDIILSVFFNQILKKEVLESAEIAALNLHPSCLPDYCGMSPILWMLAEGAEEGGATLHHMDETIDTGNIIAQEKFKIKKQDSFFNVYSNAALTGASLVMKILKKGKVPEGKIQSQTKKRYRSLSKEAFKQVCRKHSILKFK